MDITDLPFLTMAWTPGFTVRCPAHITASGELRVRLLQVLYLLERGGTQRFALDDAGRLLFASAELAVALGVNPQTADGRVLDWELTAGVKFLVWRRGQNGQHEAWVRFGGVLTGIALLQPWELRDLESVERLAMIHGLSEDLCRQHGCGPEDIDRWDTLFISKTLSEEAPSAEPGTTEGQASGF